MAIWKVENSLLTDKGVEVLSKVQAGIGSITVSRVVSGSGKVPESSLHTQTSVTNPNKEFSIIGKSSYSNGSVIDIRLDNKDVEVEFELNQIGIYVTHPDFEGEILYFICQASEPDIIPPSSVTPLVLNYSIYMRHDNVSEVTIEVSSAGSVSTEVFNAHANNEDIHVTVEEKESWDSKAPGSLAGDLAVHTGDSTIHVTAGDKEKWNGYKTIITLNHVKSGNVHQLTGLTAVSGVVSCVFTATADFVAGDTVTVDGTAYEIQLSNGEEPADNLFVSGAAVTVVIDTTVKKVNFKAGGGKKRLVTEVIAWTQKWVVPEGVPSVNVRIFGAGGGGGWGSYQGGGCGGNGGNMAYKTLSVTPGETHTIIIGKGGEGSTTSPYGTAGGSSSFGTLLSASGAYTNSTGGGSSPFGGSGGGSGRSAGAYGGNGGSSFNTNGIKGTNTIGLGLDFEGAGKGGKKGTKNTEPEADYGEGGGGGNGGYGGNGGNGGNGGEGWENTPTGASGGHGGGGGYGGNGGNGGDGGDYYGDYGGSDGGHGGGGGYGGNGGNGATGERGERDDYGPEVGHGGAGGYGPNGNGGDGAQGSSESKPGKGGFAAGGGGGGEGRRGDSTYGCRGGDGGDGICIIQYMI